VLVLSEKQDALPAVSRGILLPPFGAGIVHSVFAHAVNLRFEQDRMLVLLDARKPNVPHGIRIAAHAWSRLRGRVQAGNSAVLFDRTLRLGPGGLCVDLARAHDWRLDVAAHAIDWSKARVVAAFDTLRVGLDQHATSNTLAASRRDWVRARFLQRVSASLPSLETAMRALRAQEASAQLNALIGLGCGLTPSGDDFIIGCLAGLAISACDEAPRLRFLREIAAGLELSGTTLISGQHLRDACSLQFAQPLAELAMAIAKGDYDVGQKLTDALEIGAYSGVDGVAGLLFALQTWRTRTTDLS
jgi:hypothetical protein